MLNSPLSPGGRGARVSIDWCRISCFTRRQAFIISWLNLFLPSFLPHLRILEQFLCASRISVPQQVFAQLQQFGFNVIVNWKIAGIYNCHVQSGLKKFRLLFNLRIRPSKHQISNSGTNSYRNQRGSNCILKLFPPRQDDVFKRLKK